MSKPLRTAVKLMGKKAKLAKPVELSPYLNLIIKAGQCSPAPPLGPLLGERGINVAQFCKEINEKTAHFVDGVPIDVRIVVNPDRTYKATINTPVTPWLIMRAAGIGYGAIDVPNDVSGYLTVKHIYEIAKIKQQDSTNRGYSLEEMCKKVMAEARAIGVKTVTELAGDDYTEFLTTRKTTVGDYLQKLEEMQLAKTLRTADAADKK